MKECLIDTDVFSYYMRGLSDVVYRAQEYLKQFGCFSISSLTIFEILKGLRKKRLVEKENVFQRSTGLFWKTGGTLRIPILG